jgi:hypothetical protein
MKKQKQELTSEESPPHLERPEPHLCLPDSALVVFELPASQAGTLPPLHDQLPAVVVLRGEVNGPRTFSEITDVVLFDGEQRADLIGGVEPIAATHE